MVKKLEMKSQKQTLPRAKIAYTVPCLKKYGEVRALTQSGSKNGAEGLSAGDLKTMVPSDRSVKENIAKVGNHSFGIDIYLFDYKTEFCEEFGHGRQFGVMADEVEIVMPEAVLMHPGGFKQVNYAMLGIDRTGRRAH